MAEEAGVEIQRVAGQAAEDEVVAGVGVNHRDFLGRRYTQWAGAAGIRRRGRVKKTTMMKRRTEAKTMVRERCDRTQ